MSFNSTHTTYDHQVLKNWAAQRGAIPALWQASPQGGRLGFRFLQQPTATPPATELSWEAFFEEFEARQLALLFEDNNDEGKLSHKYTLIDRSLA